MGNRRRRGSSKVWGIGGVAVVGVAVIALAGVALAEARQEEPANAGSVAESGFVQASPQVAPTVRPLVLPEDPAVLIFGDSFPLGVGMENSRQPTYPTLLADAMGWTNLQVNAVGGTGLAASSTDGPYDARLAAAPDDFTPDLVIVQGSINDIKPGPQLARTGTADLLADLTVRWPAAQVVLVTPMTGDTAYEPLADAYAGAALGKAHVIDSTGTESWLPADRPELRTVDTWHPSPAGQRAIADGLAAALQALLAA
ncbi:SGNH/GDSL hydrolase family protein [Clavibacter michiganensis subsp. michiganensis]|uniref:SGNH/GDSL hydrolase family protein n=1 Tax=Clavibacter michiganensis TaxID=28447 RepID=UPI001C6482E0|nr:SGNH/GDSL hydrolase family protein [Clavibacter michiganensis]MBW8025279.1 SGNH/GDSL hydrolase family protein [Clavibacter michiganensis subsp. michiganensis]